MSKLQKIASVAVIGIVLASLTSWLLSGNNIVQSTVYILNKARNSGGTGVILSSSKHESVVLTNAHVCNLVAERGGFVEGTAGSFSVAATKISEEHDICLLKVTGDLKSSTKIASRAPDPFYETATVSGHPGLMPTVVTTGHFSGFQNISIVVGSRECNEEDFKSGLGAICSLVGRMPILKSFDSQLVTATIMPGSSGSGIYNSDGELSGLVFAGRGELGYAWTVPYSAMKRFLEVEQFVLLYKRPTNLLDLNAEAASKRRDFESELEKACKRNPALSDICEDITSDMIWRR